MTEVIGKKEDKWSKTVEFFKSLGFALLIALVIRSFIVEPFKIPSGSMLPTLLIGDHIFVNKFVYGLRVPFTKLRFWEGRNPKRGEVIIFWETNDSGRNFIKRVVGLPGDTIRVENDLVYVNGSAIPTQAILVSPDLQDFTHLNIDNQVPYPHINTFEGWNRFNFVREEASGASYVTQLPKDAWPSQFDEVKVPENHFFVMGDNRRHSSDSREWGFVPRSYIKGRAMFIWLSLKRRFEGVRWDRFGRWIY